MFSLLCLALCGLFLGNTGVFASPYTLNAGELGPITGYELLTSQTLRVYYEFDAIPYAQDVTGANRFKPSKLREGPLTADGSAFNGTNPLNICPQSNLLGGFSKVFSSIIPKEVKGHIRELGGENCLRAFIHTPKVNQDGNLLPVIVYIHGGSFTGMWGSLFNGGRLMERDVVVVSINYRLGVLGFFNLETNDAPGNAGLYDIVTSLEWVQKYIHHFGGDKNLVTIAGQSAGAAAVIDLLVSPLGNGLFHRAIAGSGTGLLEWATAEDPLPHSMRIAELVGCTTNNADKPAIISCMQTASVDSLIDAMDVYTKEERKNAGLGFWAGSPSVQRASTITIPKILPESPIDVMRKNQQKNIPLMMGTTRHDGSAVLDTAMSDFLEANDLLDDPEYIKNQLLIDLMKVLGLNDRSEAMIDAVGVTYMGNAHYSDQLEPKMQGLIDIFSVFFFKAMSFQTIQYHSTLNENSYWYSFDFEGIWSLFGLINSHDFPAGVSHADDLLYLFQFLPFLTSNEKRVSERYIDYHVNFATHGNPNGNGARQIWPKFSAANPSFLKIDSEDTLGNNYKQDWKNASEGLFPAPTRRPIITTVLNAGTPPTEKEDDKFAPGASNYLRSSLIAILFSFIIALL